ncbi:uncharacterized protein LOC133203890 [Saccostrea echinata]|uniref:uncharacterized protein LOC133203890 n=1 Tax=Saccostrea echinata TaxID=191078 RepID=UPI002A821047|nr:uncharacterized protein LOC133203890 [Saccostrea echinata]
MGENDYDNVEIKTLSMADFAGQCVYYAFHQVYLRRRAFYILVTDMTKDLEMKVGSVQCQQDGTMFSDWTYKDYFVFWLRSLHVYCENDTPVIIVASHRDQTDAEALKIPFFDKLLESLPEQLDLKRHLNFKRYFSIGLGVEDDIENLKTCIFDLATNLPTWGEYIPAKWEAFECSILKRTDKIMHKSELRSMEIFPSDVIDDMLRFYHETGVILNFNEGHLADIIILDVQWFVDAFKLIFSDENHVKQMALYTAEWRDLNSTGDLNDNYLQRIWNGNNSYIQNKDRLLDYMQRLGLIAKGSSSHYVPCMNKKNFDEHERLTLRKCSYKSSILMFRFDFLPYFIFCRLVVACMCAEGGAWKTLLDEKNERKALYKNTAMFTYEENIVVLSVTNESILTQVFVRGRKKISKIAIQSIRHSLINNLEKITGTFHKSLTYEIGFGCKKKIVGEFSPEKIGFVPESDLKKKSEISCPFHQRSGFHTIYAQELFVDWNPNHYRKGINWTKSLLFWSRENLENESTSEVSELNESREEIDKEKHGSEIENIQLSDEEWKKHYHSVFIKLTAISRDALQLYFDGKFSESDLENVLSTYKDEMRKGQYKFVEEQLLILYPGDGSCPSSSKFDVTIMYKLLRNYGKDLPEPSQGWGKTPKIGDTKETDDLERIRYYRNKFSHATPKTSFMEKDEFQMYWMDLSQAVLRISNRELKADVDKLEKQIGAKK